MRQVLFTATLAVLFISMACHAVAGDYDRYIPPAGKYNVKILRDEYGVPHIYGKTDADAAYGLAFAHCEDDFTTMQDAMLSSRGMMSLKDPLIGTAMDFALQFFEVWDTVNAEYDTIAPDVRAICEAYAEGCNHYAALHPEQMAAPEMMPATGKDIVAGFVLKAPFFWGFERELMKLATAKKPLEVSTKVAALQSAADWYKRGAMLGSNSFAVAPSRAADGYTRLDINSHQPWDGPVSWYEAYVHSEEGWDCSGGVFVGAPVILHGYNRHLGWAHTVNNPDLVDTYLLTINPQNPNQYKYDGEWKDFETKPIGVRIPIWGDLSYTYVYTLKKSVHGPAFETPFGTYAIRIAGKGNVHHVEQIFRMNKAKNLDEFKAAFDLHGIPSFNTCYADEKGNIWYLYNANMPKRAPGWDYSKVLPGDTSACVWKERDYVPVSELPQVLNPKSGYVISCNNDPCHSSTGDDIPKREKLPAMWGIETQMTNRARRALELFDADKAITREKFKEYKYDWGYSKSGPLKELLDKLFALPPQDDPLVNEAIELIKKWDWQTDPENTSAAMAILTAEPIVRAEMFGLTPPDILETLKKRAKLLKDKHGRLDVPWKEVNRMVRGKLDIGLGGGPDVLYAVYGSFDEKTCTCKGMAGEGYVALVEWSPEGKMSAQTLHQYGSAISNPDSPHYADQALLFQKREMKPAHFEREDLDKHVTARYSPGEKWSYKQAVAQNTAP